MAFAKIRPVGILMRVKLKFPSILNLNRKTLMLNSRFSYPESRCPTMTMMARLTENPGWSITSVLLKVLSVNGAAQALKCTEMQLSELTFQRKMSCMRNICEFGKRNSIRYDSNAAFRQRDPIKLPAEEFEIPYIYIYIYEVLSAAFSNCDVMSVPVTHCPSGSVWRP